MLTCHVSQTSWLCKLCSKLYRCFPPAHEHVLKIQFWTAVSWFLTNKMEKKREVLDKHEWFESYNGQGWIQERRASRHLGTMPLLTWYKKVVQQDSNMLHMLSKHFSPQKYLPHVAQGVKYSRIFKAWLANVRTASTHLSTTIHKSNEALAQWTWNYICSNHVHSLEISST